MRTAMGDLSRTRALAGVKGHVRENVHDQLDKLLALRNELTEEKAP